MARFTDWKEFRKELNLSQEDEMEIELEVQLIEATIEARKNANLTQRDLSELSGIKQPSIAKIESLVHSPQASTLIKLLYPMGYTLKIVPIEKEDKKKKVSKRKEKVLD